MSKIIIFVKTRYEYDSYQDFWSLVSLSGYPTCYVDEVDVTREDTVYITTPIQGEWRPHLDNHRHKLWNAHLILWQLERPANSGGSVGGYGKDNRQLMYDRYFDEIWVSDQELASNTGLRFVPLGSHPDLGEVQIIGRKHYDAVHMSYIVPRRETIYNRVKKLAPNGWGETRHRTLKGSKCAINIHQDNFPFVEPLRFALFAAYGLPVISEHVKNTYPYEDKIIWRDYDEIISTLKDGLKNYNNLYEYGLQFRKFLCEENNFRKWVDKAIFEDGVWKE